MHSVSIGDVLRPVEGVELWVGDARDVLERQIDSGVVQTVVRLP